MFIGNYHQGNWKVNIKKVEAKFQLKIRIKIG